MTKVTALFVINITAFSYCFCFRYDLALRLSFILSLFLLRLTIAFFSICFVI